MLHRDEVFSPLPSATLHSALTADLAGQMLRERKHKPFESVSSKHNCYGEGAQKTKAEDNGEKRQVIKEGKKTLEGSEKLTF